MTQNQHIWKKNNATTSSNLVSIPSYQKSNIGLLRNNPECFNECLGKSIYCGKLCYRHKNDCTRKNGG
jgi:hypothetical protein